MDYLKFISDNIGFIILAVFVIIIAGKYMYDKYKARPQQRDEYMYYPQSNVAPKDPFKQEATVNIIEDLQHKRDNLVMKLNTIRSEADNLPIKRRELADKYKNDNYFLEQRYETLKKEWELNNTQLQTVNELLTKVRQ